MKRFFHRAASLLATAALATVVSAAEPEAKSEPSRVLLVTGIDYQGHHWKKTAPPLRAVLEKDPRLEVRIVDDVDSGEPSGRDRLPTDDHPALIGPSGG